MTAATKSSISVQVRKRLLRTIRPSPENDRLYHKTNGNDESIRALAESIRRFGVKEPLVLTQDGYILSGHRRYYAAQLAGKQFVPVRYEQVRRSGNFDEFLQLLREYNRQRVKTGAEMLREEVVSADPDDPYVSLIDFREEQAEINGSGFRIIGEKKRSKLTDAKFPLVNAICRIIRERSEFLPLTVRAIHYALLNAPPLRHASKPDSTYRNDKESYRDTCDTILRARIEGWIEWESITDETRPVEEWYIHSNTGAFISLQLDHFLKNYYRDLMQSQPNHIEIVTEKVSIYPIVKRVAMEFRIPVSAGRGYCSGDHRYRLVERFRQSGKEKLVTLILSDLDPDGDEIAMSFARSMRDDFRITKLHPVKVALCQDHVNKFDLPRGLVQAKRTSPNYAKYRAKYGTDDAWELEALEPADLQDIVREAVDQVIDAEAFNEELAKERVDRKFLDSVRLRAHESLATLQLEGPDGEGAS